MTLEEISKVFNIDRQTVLNYMRRYGIKTRSKAARDQYGEKSSQWKGGRVKRQDGYIYVIAYNHPAAHCNYVLEHRLIMEQSIGRYLTKDEIVHHLNGIRDDNRIENLQIMDSGKHSTMHNNQRKSHGGWKLSEETKKKQSIAMTRRWAERRGEAI